MTSPDRARPLSEQLNELCSGLASLAISHPHLATHFHRADELRARLAALPRSTEGTPAKDWLDAMVECAHIAESMDGGHWIADEIQQRIDERSRTASPAATAPSVEAVATAWEVRDVWNEGVALLQDEKAAHFLCEAYNGNPGTHARLGPYAVHALHAALPSVAAPDTTTETSE